MNVPCACRDCWILTGETRHILCLDCDMAGCEANGGACHWRGFVDDDSLALGHSPEESLGWGRGPWFRVPS